jgi:tRNA (cmo5U34)-methyltransferase
MAEGQFHLDPDTYLTAVRAEVPAYDDLQRAIAAACAGRSALRVLDLGVGTGETTRAVQAVAPGAHVVAVDASEQMVRLVRRDLPAVDARVGRLEDGPPPGPFDLVVSALAVHHLDGPGKQQLFTRVAHVLAPGGRFVLGDVVVPDDPSHAVAPLEPGVDLPDRLDDLLAWLDGAGLRAELVWQAADLVVIAADR